MFETTIVDGVLQVARSGTRWLSTGWDGGFHDAAVAYNITVPEGWDCADLDGYVAERRAGAEFDTDGPALLTGVEMQHARGARLDPVVAYATVGLSNPAALPLDPDGHAESEEVDSQTEADHTAGTVNLILGTTRGLDDAALANLLSVAAEAKAATLLAEAGFPGTTTDAIVVGCDPRGESAQFTGSATPVGAAARACVREAVKASFESRYADRAVPRTVSDAEHGISTEQRAEVFSP